MTDALLISGIILLLVLDVLVLATRTAFRGSNQTHLMAKRDGNEKPLNRALSLLRREERLFASLSLSLVLVRTFLIAGVFWMLARSAAYEVLWATVLGLTLAGFLFFWMEWLVVKKITTEPELWAIRLSPVGKIWLIVFWLPVLLVIGREDMQTPDEELEGIEEDVKTLVDAGQEGGVFEVGERRMIYSIFELGDTLVREIMIPRIDMLALDVNTPVDEAIDALIRTGHSRVPVYEDTVDGALGLLYAKDLLRVWREGGSLDSLKPLLRKPYFIPEAKKVDELLAEMQTQRIHMALVVDEYGGIAGLVTLEDIVEEILGEIQDEYDQGEESPYQALKDGEYLFQGRVDLDDFNEILGSNLIKDEADTLGGYIFSELGHVPEVGETVQKDDLLLTVEQVSARRVRKVRAHWVTPSELKKGDDDVNG